MDAEGLLGRWGSLCLGDFFIDESWSQWLPSFSPLERQACVLVSQVGLQREIIVQIYRECSVAAASSNDDSQCSKLRHLCELSCRGNSSVKLHLSAHTCLLPRGSWAVALWWMKYTGCLLCAVRSVKVSVTNVWNEVAAVTDLLCEWGRLTAVCSLLGPQFSVASVIAVWHFQKQWQSLHTASISVISFAALLNLQSFVHKKLGTFSTLSKTPNLLTVSCLCIPL